MTEKEWLACTDPTPMLEFIRGKVSDRKLRLFIVACARCLWDQIPEGELRQSVEVGEKQAEGLASDEEVRQLRSDIYSYWGMAATPDQRSYTFGSLEKKAIFAHSYCCTLSSQGLSNLRTLNNWSDCGLLTRQVQPTLLREVVGNPFRPVTVDPSWLTSTVLSLAQQMYESRDFSAMPILADALQDAGCENDDILNHCRDENLVHVRGCWALDLVLGKS